MSEQHLTPPPGEENVLADYYEGYQQLQLQAAETNIRKARNALFITAGIILVVNLAMLASADALYMETVVIIVSIAAVFTALGFLTRRQPFTAILIGLILFVLIWIIDIAVLGPEQLIRGILFRGIIIYFLASAIRPAREAERIRKELQSS
jgi:hypothetical protein